MIKQAFITEITPTLQKLDYHKRGPYWYKTIDKHICCINVQGSQWNKDDYYVELGYSYASSNNKNPTILQWYCRHRCTGEFGELNITPQDLFASIEEVFNQITLTSQISDFLQNHNAIRVGTQLWF